MSVGHDNQNQTRPSRPSYTDRQPVPVALILDGLCAVDGIWPDGLWDFTVAGESQQERGARREYAQEVCAICPVRQQCAVFAADNDESGVWGGKVFFQGEVSVKGPSGGEGGDEEVGNTQAPNETIGGLVAVCRTAYSA